MDKTIEALYTKIEEFKETIDPTDYSVDGMVQRIATESLIRGLLLAIQIIQENEVDNGSPTG